MAIDSFTDTNGDDAPDTSVLVGHGDASGIVSRFDPASGQSDLVLTFSEFAEDVAVNSTGDIYTTSEIPSGPGFDTRLRKNGLVADLLPGEPGGLAPVPLPEPGFVVLLAGWGCWSLWRAEGRSDRAPCVTKATSSPGMKLSGTTR